MLTEIRRNFDLILVVVLAVVALHIARRVTGRALRLSI